MQNWQFIRSNIMPELRLEIYFWWEIEYIPVMETRQHWVADGRMRRLKVGSDEEERERRDTSCLRQGLVSTMRVRCGRPPGLEFANNKLIARRSTLDKRWHYIFKQQQVYQELGSNPFPRKYRLNFWQDQNAWCDEQRSLLLVNVVKSARSPNSRTIMS